MVIRRDPVSEQFDAAARKLLRRAYANPGHWTGTYLGRPPVVWRAWATYHGIGLEERDRWGEVRWVRAFKRSVYWNLAWYGGAAELRAGRRTAPGGAKALVWETGKLVMKPGWPGRRYAIRVKLMPGGQAAAAAVQRQREAKRFTDNPAYRSTLADRDYLDACGSRWTDRARDGPAVRPIACMASIPGRPGRAGQVPVSRSVHT